MAEIEDAGETEPLKQLEIGCSKLYNLGSLALAYVFDRRSAKRNRHAGYEPQTEQAYQEGAVCSRSVTLLYIKSSFQTALEMSYSIS